ncbi:MAG: response regulator [Bacteroidota bacterium]|nr:response regulator [Bacteroidota bacterium]
MEYYGNNKAPENKDLNSLSGNGETILFIDDETAFVEVTKLLLKLFGYNILIAYDGVEGISVFKANREQINIIVCDLNMPKLGGKAMLQKFLEIDPAIKILIISGSIEEDYLAQYLCPEKIEFLQKPFLTERLLETLKKMLQQKSKN